MKKKQPHAPDERRTLIVTKPEGQLGNRLFLAATFVSHAAKRGLRVMLPALGEYANLFCGTSRSLFPAFPKNKDSFSQGQRMSLLLRPMWLRKAIAHAADRAAKSLAHLQTGSFGIRVLDITRSHDAQDGEYDLDTREFENLTRGRGALLLRGWKFRDHAALQEQHELVRDFFSPVECIRKQAEAAVGAARQNVDWLVGVHVRQGDYREFLGGRYFFETSRYEAWMAEVARIQPGRKVGFLVCTNGHWGAEKVADCPVFRGPGSPAGDLYTLAGCDAIIGPPSSFSLWASYYNRVPLLMLEHSSQVIHPVSFTLHPKI